jgi:hypothetical protein
MKLKNLGVYALPDGREFVVEMEHGGYYRLYSKHAWSFARIAQYQILNDGKLIRKGTPTHWRVEHLIDTGHKVTYPKASHVL